MEESISTERVKFWLSYFWSVTKEMTGLGPSPYETCINDDPRVIMT